MCQLDFLHFIRIKYYLSSVGSHERASTVCHLSFLKRLSVQQTYLCITLTCTQETIHIQILFIVPNSSGFPLHGKRVGRMGLVTIGGSERVMFTHHSLYITKITNPLWAFIADVHYCFMFLKVLASKKLKKSRLDPMGRKLSYLSEDAQVLSA